MKSGAQAQNVEQLRNYIYKMWSKRPTAAPGESRDLCLQVEVLESQVRHWHCWAFQKLEIC